MAMYHLSFPSSTRINHISIKHTEDLTDCVNLVQSVGSGAQGEVSFLAWNHKVPHILASTSYNGATGEREIILLSTAFSSYNLYSASISS